MKDGRETKIKQFTRGIENVPRKRVVSKRRVAKTNKRGENVLGLIDISSPCICFHGQVPLQRPRHCLDENDSRSSAAHLYPASSLQRGSRAVCLPLRRFVSREVRATLPPSLLLPGADRNGIVCRHIPGLSITEPGD